MKDKILDVTLRFICRLADLYDLIKRKAIIIFENFIKS